MALWNLRVKGPVDNRVHGPSPPPFIASQDPIYFALTPSPNSTSNSLFLYIFCLVTRLHQGVISVSWYPEDTQRPAHYSLQSPGNNRSWEASLRVQTVARQYLVAVLRAMLVLIQNEAIFDHCDRIFWRTNGMGSGQPKGHRVAQTQRERGGGGATMWTNDFTSPCDPEAMGVKLFRLFKVLIIDSLSWLTTTAQCLALQMSRVASHSTFNFMRSLLGFHFLFFHETNRPHLLSCCP